VTNALDPQPVKIPVLLPHELLDALARAGSQQAPAGLNPTTSAIATVFFTCFDVFTVCCPCQFATSLLGNRSCEAVQEFWDHCLKFPDWAHHPVFSDGTVDRKRLYLSHHFTVLSIECTVNTT